MGWIIVLVSTCQCFIFAFFLIKIILKGKEVIMFGGAGGNKFDMLKQMKKMRSQVKTMEKELAGLNFVGISKNKLLSVTLDGKFQMKSIQIEDELLDKKDKNLLEKSIQEAYTKALQDAQAGAAKQMQAMGGFPGLGM
ncbi:YbaB/EbfC family nucleoid-associated protein [Leptospira abararensis]|nr:YbaB/EbfC family nucleoid-associated protein [Leptospira abararensis]